MEPAHTTETTPLLQTTSTDKWEGTSLGRQFNGLRNGKGRYYGEEVRECWSEDTNEDVSACQSRSRSAHSALSRTIVNGSEVFLSPTDGSGKALPESHCSASTHQNPSGTHDFWDFLSGITLTLENSGSVARDHLASERTFLAYMRTSLAFASAGVGEPCFFDLFHCFMRLGISTPVVERSFTSQEVISGLMASLNGSDTELMNAVRLLSTRPTLLRCINFDAWNLLSSTPCLYSTTRGWDCRCRPRCLVHW